MNYMVRTFMAKTQYNYNTQHEFTTCAAKNRTSDPRTERRMSSRKR